VRGRANVLRAVSDGIGLKGEDIVPPDEEIKAQMQAAQSGPPGGGPPGGAPGAPQQGKPGGQQPDQGGPQGQGGPPQPGPKAPQAPQTNVVGKTSVPGKVPQVSPAQGPA
jgi:hypothetical protein